jgi:hypothetical protein
MYTLLLYTICLVLVLLIGAVLFAAFAALVAIREGCHMMVAMAATVWSRLCLSATEQRSTRLVPRYALPQRSESIGASSGHRVVSLSQFGQDGSDRRPPRLTSTVSHL